MYAIAACAAALPVVVFGPIHGQESARADRIRARGRSASPGRERGARRGCDLDLAAGSPYRQVVVPGPARRAAPSRRSRSSHTALAANLWAIRPWLLALLAGPAFTLTLSTSAVLLHSPVSRDGMRLHRPPDRPSATTARTRRRCGERIAVSFGADGGSPLLALSSPTSTTSRPSTTPYGHSGRRRRSRAGSAKCSASRDHAQAFSGFGGDEFAVIFVRDEVNALPPACEEIPGAARARSRRRAVRTGDDQRRHRASPPIRRINADDLRRRRRRRALLVEGARQEPFVPLQPVSRPDLLA